MNVRGINQHLLRGQLEAPGLFPHLEGLAGQPFRFEVDFGLPELPTEPGVLLIRGPRQFGKSTWLEAQVRATVETHGAGTAFYLNGDELADRDALIAAIRGVVPLYRRDAPVRRLFLDEVTAVDEWVTGLKRLIDAGELRDVLVVTTGSRATDLRRGAERLPGRKGKLARTAYWFTPISFAAFTAVCGDALGDDATVAYLLSGGCPIAAGEIASRRAIPEHIVEMVRDWIFGEIAAAGRDRRSLLGIWDVIHRRGGTPIGQLGLARDAGLANNTVAASYVELLSDLMCLGTAHAWDPERKVVLRRRPAKFPPINLLAAVAFDPNRLRSIDEFRALDPEKQGRWHEWLVAQEIWRRRAIAGDPIPEQLLYWSSKRHEIDFVVRDDLLVEVKRARSGPLEFAWFAHTFPQARLELVTREPFEADRIRGRTLEGLLLADDW